ncbi:MAG: type III-A CRISPR-associated RAMP protein Csm3 [Candidatus Cloacimonadota bacterium]|jgi:CRISPR-associated protein Csm3|nr:type III-A CRISPR-associated RAMP protein Csm3 [Candidatus Cloacimonadota bacterium]
MDNVKYSNVIFSGKILLLSGLHIGGSDSGVKIGGIDSPVIKNPISGLPYIPGSSLKGKMRFLLEHYYQVVPSSGDISSPMHNGKRNEVAIVFGHMEHANLKFQSYPTRVIFRDSNITGAVENIGSCEGPVLTQPVLDIATAKMKMNSLFVEGKTEVAIDRNTGTVKQKGGGLRQVERVPAGTVFDLEIVLRVFDNNEKDEHLKIIKQGLKLLQNDALGGYGSRGGGRVKFFDLKVDDQALDLNDIAL